MKLWVANTDPDWFDFLSAQHNVDEVNFWQPSGSMNFKAVEPGDLFVFKLKSPRNAIGGYGVFTQASILPLSLAWDAFGIKNGVGSFSEMHQRIRRYRSDLSIRTDYQIGCRVVVSPVFFPPNLWFPQPASWANSIVVGKTYDTDDVEGRSIWEKLQQTAELIGSNDLTSVEQLADRRMSYDSGSKRFGNPTRVIPRLGQGAFRLAVTEAYKRECAISGGRVLPALEAAHIKPYWLGGDHKLSNGLLLRRDIHSVFDAGYATFDDDLRLVVSNRVRTEFNNGNEYLKLIGSQIKLPNDVSARPSMDNIRWHQNEIYVD